MGLGSRGETEGQESRSVCKLQGLTQRHLTPELISTVLPPPPPRCSMCLSLGSFYCAPSTTSPPESLPPLHQLHTQPPSLSHPL